MAEKGQSEEKSMGLGMIFLLIILGLFILWIFTGGPQGKTKTTTTKTVEKSVWPASGEVTTYGQIKK